MDDCILDHMRGMAVCYAKPPYANCVHVAM
jgi:hypothetical protein